MAEREGEYTTISPTPLTSRILAFFYPQVYTFCPPFQDSVPTLFLTLQAFRCKLLFMDKQNIFNLIDTKLREHNVDIPAPVLDHIKSDFWNWFETLPERAPSVAALFEDDDDPKGFLIVFRMWLSGQRHHRSKRLLKSSYYFLGIIIAIIFGILLLIFKHLWLLAAFLIIVCSAIFLYKRYHLSEEEHANIKGISSIFSQIYNAMLE